MPCSKLLILGFAAEFPVSVVRGISDLPVKYFSVNIMTSTEQYETIEKKSLKSIVKQKKNSLFILTLIYLLYESSFRLRFIFVLQSWGSRLAQRIFLRFTPMSPGFDPQFRHLCAFDCQSKLASVGFFPGPPVFNPASKTGLLS